ncbi:general stress protein [Niallia sp. XMNu-256]|uniref:low temperature-induced protein n=1 Tax=Niallia sp. XMNu-256 TaxID=3082444 RepID=UPI0030CEDA0E
MQKSIVGGVFKNAAEVEGTIRRLKALGIDTNKISVLAKNDDTLNEIKEQTNVDTIDNDSNRGKNAGKGAGIGAGTGGVLGGIVGIIAEVGLLTIPGVGVLAAAGPLATALSGAAIGAAGGGLVGALAGAGIPESEAKIYDNYIKDGNIVLLVEIDEAQRIEIERTFADNCSINTGVYALS